MPREASSQRDLDAAAPIVFGRGRARLFAHDDQYDEQDYNEPSSDQNADGEWQQPTPSWRNRIAGDESQSDEQRRRGNSIISAGSAFTGTLRSEDPLYIEGAFEGEIIASSDVTIARGAVVNARVQAIRMTVAGSLDGSVACTDRFEVVESGVVAAEIFSPVFVIHEGATINGSFRMRVDDDDVAAAGDSATDDDDDND